MTTVRRRFAATALAATVLAAGAGTAGVAGATRIVRINSKISISGHGLTFKGRVTSSNAACESARKVTLWRTNGNKLGTATTSASGHWKVTASGSAGISLGHFFATVKPRAEGTAGTIYVCRGARSRTIPFHQ
jgi:hypothetical protein